MSCTSELEQHLHFELRFLQSMQVVSLYKGKQTSANLPYKVTFIIPQEGAKDIRLVAHLVHTHNCSGQDLHLSYNFVLLFQRRSGWVQGAFLNGCTSSYELVYYFHKQQAITLQKAVSMHKAQQALLTPCVAIQSAPEIEVVQ